MLSQMALQEDKELRSYIQILHPPQQKYCTHTKLYSSTVWTCITNQLLLDGSQPLNVLANSAYCSHTVSLLETARLKPKPTTSECPFTVISHPSDIYLTTNSTIFIAHVHHHSH